MVNEMSPQANQNERATGQFDDAGHEQQIDVHRDGVADKIDFKSGHTAADRDSRTVAQQFGVAVGHEHCGYQKSKYCPA